MRQQAIVEELCTTLDTYSPTAPVRRRELLWFLPAAALACALAWVAAGGSLVPGATAANEVTVDGSVVAGIYVSPDTSQAACGNGTLSVGDFTDGAFRASASTCTVQYATNSMNGALLTIRDSDATNPFFCIASVCASDNGSLDNVASSSGGSTLGDDQFGVAIVGTSGAPTPVAGASFEIDSTPTGSESIWAPLGTSAATLCETSALTTATHSCSIRFGVDGQGATQTAGAYSGTATIEAAVKP